MNKELRRSAVNSYLIKNPTVLIRRYVVGDVRRANWCAL